MTSSVGAVHSSRSDLAQASGFEGAFDAFGMAPYAHLAGADTHSDNNVQLPDEYDQIDKDLVPFRALHPNDILKRVAKAASEPDTFTIKVRRGLVRTSASVNGYDELHMSRRTGQYELIRPIAKYLPDMTVVYTVHDTPSNFVSHEHKEELLEHIEEDECEWLKHLDSQPPTDARH